MSAPVVVIGIGNAYRRDDGLGLAVADEIAMRALPGIRVHSGLGESSALLDVWAGAELAVVVDAIVCTDVEAGRIRRFTCDAVAVTRMTSSHGMAFVQAYELGKILGRNPSRLVLYTVAVVDDGHGVGLTPAISAAVPQVAAAIIAEAAETLADGG